jgi:hypothetical protein
MKPRHAAALALVVLGALSACSPIEHHTDKRAAMARMTFSPEKCEQVGEVYERCGGEHALPDANSGVAESGMTNDTSLIRGICQQGFHYETGGCQKD